MSSSEMVTTPIKRGIGPFPVRPGKLLPIMLACVLVLALGLLAAGLYLAPDVAAPALAVLGFGIPILWLVWQRPEFGLLALVFLTSGFIMPNAIDVRLPIGGLDARDLTLLGLGGLVLVQALLRHEFALPRRWVGTTLVVFWVLAISSALYGWLSQGVEPQWVFGELRPLAYYATFFIAALTIRTRNQLVTLLIGLFILADLTAGVLIFQEFLGGSNLILAAMTGGAWNIYRAADPSTGFGAVRMIPPGHVLTYAMSIIAFCLVMSPDSRPLWRAGLALQFVYLNLGLLFTYTRAQWVASAIALALAVILLPRLGKARLIRYGLGLVVALLLGYSLFGGDVQEALKDRPFFTTLTTRAMSIFTPSETLESSSLEWRLFETDESLRSISEHPLLGVGLGGVYRNVTLLRGEAAAGYRGYLRFTRFVHNSYLYLAVKMGLPGLLAFLVFAAALLAMCWRQYARTRDALHGSLALAILTALVGFLAWCVSQSHLLQPESTAVVGLLAAIVASMPHIEGTAAAGNAVNAR